jgi:rod shape determining protein RodA
MKQVHRAFGLDPLLVILLVILSATGVMLIYSATQDNPSQAMQDLFKRQILWFAIGFVLMYVTSRIPLKIFFAMAYVIYALCIGALLFLFITTSGSKEVVRWFSFYGIKLQPSEFAKIGTLLALARYFSINEVRFERPQSLIFPVVLVLAPFLLIVIQPDLSTSLVFLILLFPLLFWNNFRFYELFFLASPVLSLILSFNYLTWGFFFVCVVLLIIKFQKNIILSISIFSINLAAGIITPLVWSRFLKDYHRNRILTLLDPQNDPLGAGYQVIQSKVTIGSGGLTGKGFLEGSQTNLSFLPEQHTDFIFSVLGEQFGFLGVVAVIFIFAFLIFRLISYLPTTNNRFANFITIGIITHLTFHIIVNLSMTVGLMPVTGLPLPFLSYGGSFLITIFIQMGMIANAENRKTEF